VVTTIVKTVNASRAAVHTQRKQNVGVSKKEEKSGHLLNG
jgi:hypothetical protein